MKIIKEEIVEAIDSKLLPKTAHINDDGRLSVAGCDLLDLASEYGTPLFVYDEEHIVQRCREVAENSSGLSVYATKAFLCRALVKLIAPSGLGFDFSTAGELEALLNADADIAKTVFHGNNKTKADLHRALEIGVGRIVVDSEDELERLEELYLENHRVAKILIRITPGIEIHTHEYIASGMDDSKFGLTVSSGWADKVIKRAQASPAVELMGLHAHVGSQVLDINLFQRAAQEIINFAKPYQLAELSLGGGLGVAHTAEEMAIAPQAWLAAIAQAAEASDFKAPISIEPGRSIVAQAGMTLYTVGTIKRLEGLRTYVAVDGGMSDNIRPALYGSDYEAFLPRAANRSRSQAVRVVGHHCESADMVVRNGWLPDDLSLGDILAVPVTGAYNYSMASNYNRTPRPAVVFVKGGRARVVIRRETLADFERLEPS